MINMYQGLIAPCPECGDEAGVCEHRYGNTIDNDTTRTVYFDEAGVMHEMADEETCMHGMSAWLCAHPVYHYPTDEMMMRGQYY